MEMMALVYSPPLEEEELIPELDWEKQTVQYLINNENKVIRLINYKAKKLSSFISADAEDVYIESLLYFKSAPDYDINKAILRSENGKPITLENYINACITCVLNRQIAKIYKRNTELANVLYDDEGKVESLFERLADESLSELIENAGTDIRSDLTNIEHKRYKFGIDIFQLFYIRLLTMNISEKQYRNILEALGITKKTLKDLEAHLIADDDVMQVIKAISISKNEKAAISALEKKVYGAKVIKETINNFCKQ